MFTLSVCGCSDACSWNRKFKEHLIDKYIESLPSANHSGFRQVSGIREQKFHLSHCFSMPVFREL